MEINKMTVNQIMKEVGTINKHAATNMKIKSREIPKIRRCEMCLSYSDYTIPISVEMCGHCYEILLSRREKVYTLSRGMALHSFKCDMCRKKSFSRFEINPYVCKSCANRFFNYITENIKNRG